MPAPWAREIAAVKSALSLVEARMADPGCTSPARADGVATDASGAVGAVMQGLTDALVALESLAATPAAATIAPAAAPPKIADPQQPVETAPASDEPATADPFRTRVRVKSRTLADAIPTLLAAETTRCAAAVPNTTEPAAGFAAVTDFGAASMPRPDNADGGGEVPSATMPESEPAAIGAHAAALAAHESIEALSQPAELSDPAPIMAATARAEPVEATDPRAFDLSHVLEIIRAQAAATPAEPASDSIAPGDGSAIDAGIAWGDEAGPDARLAAIEPGIWALDDPGLSDTATADDPPRWKAAAWLSIAPPAHDADFAIPPSGDDDGLPPDDQDLEAEVEIVIHAADCVRPSAAMTPPPGAGWRPQAPVVHELFADMPAAYRGQSEEATVVIVQRRGERSDVGDLPFYQTSPSERRESKVRRFLSALSGDRS